MRIKQILTNIQGNILNRPKSPEMNTGIASLDEVMWGFKRGETVVVAGRTSMGKTSFMLHCARNLAKKGKKVIFISMEMSMETIAERFLVMENRIDNEKLLKSDFTAEEKAKLEDSIKFMDDIDFNIQDDLGFKWEQVKAHVVSVKPDIMFVDYIQMIPHIAGKNERESYSEYVRMTKEIAKQNNICIVLGSQVNRNAVEEKIPDIPKLHQLKGSGTLEENVDCVLLCHWPWKYQYSMKEGKTDYSQNDYFIDVAKNRNGRVGVAKMEFIPEWYTFRDK